MATHALRLRIRAVPSFLTLSVTSRSPLHLCRRSPPSGHSGVYVCPGRPFFSGSCQGPSLNDSAKLCPIGQIRSCLSAVDRQSNSIFSFCCRFIGWLASPHLSQASLWPLVTRYFSILLSLIWWPQPVTSSSIHGASSPHFSNTWALTEYLLIFYPIFAPPLPWLVIPRLAPVTSPYTALFLLSVLIYRATAGISHAFEHCRYRIAWTFFLSGCPSYSLPMFVFIQPASILLPSTPAPSVPCCYAIWSHRNRGSRTASFHWCHNYCRR